MKQIQLSGEGSLVLYEKENAKAVILICPGGGYAHLSPREAEPVVRAFMAEDFSAAICSYPIYEGTPLGQRPLKCLCECVEKVKEATALPVVTCGFSAGAHLCATLGVHGKMLGMPVPKAQILCYPVITAGEYAHRESILNLTQEDPDFYALEKHVHAQVPPTFLWHTEADIDVPVENSLLFYEALRKAGVKTEMHLYANGVHGLSLVTKEVEQPEKDRFADAHVARWFQACVDWLKETIL